MKNKSAKKKRKSGDIDVGSGRPDIQNENRRHHIYGDQRGITKQ